MFKFIHGADFHLDSAFGALSPRQAAGRRRESRELVFRLANYVNRHDIDLVLLAGDLLTAAAPTGRRESSWPRRWARWRPRCSSLPATTTGTAPAVRG